MFSFIELPLYASRHFSMIFLINACVEEDMFIRREALKKVNISSLNQVNGKTFSQMTEIKSNSAVY